MNPRAISAIAARPTAGDASFTLSEPFSAKNAATFSGSWLHQAWAYRMAKSCNSLISSGREANSFPYRLAFETIGKALELSEIHCSSVHRDSSDAVSPASAWLGRGEQRRPTIAPISIQTGIKRSVNAFDRGLYGYRGFSCKSPTDRPSGSRGDLQFETGVLAARLNVNPPKST